MVVLDDFHHFVSEPVLKLLDRVVQYQPELLHLVISSRVDPALPVAQWRVRNWLVEFRAAELRFREEEAKAFFEQVLTRDAVDLIFQRTEGWAAGMQLARLSLVALARADTAKAREYADAARDFAVEVKDAYSMAISEVFEIRLNMASHRMPAGAFANAPPVDGNQFFLELPSLTYAEHLLCNDDPPDCQAGLAYAQSAVEQLRQHHNTRQLIQFMAVRAVALHRMGRLDEALTALEEVLAMAQPLGFVRTFVDRGRPMAELLHVYRERKPSAAYTRRILDAFGDKTSEARSNPASDPSPESETRGLALISVRHERFVKRNS